ncbi:hypothetical protein [Kitasatospora sp. CB02891]|uniref:hypothetical protein n=1 Tax=Kitasatospora sp. CB02891 TaxID=2020329 RepID=UPI000C27E8C5|nr:hypothetical protein [Kitasatospora sp. CB02891]PJN21931.1 hypothetical protein CG736_30890 [Kitasatospora sp. CB02891]
MAAEEIPGAREELRRRGERLYAEFAALLEAVAPGMAPPAVLPEHPDITAFGNPLSFGHHRQVAFDRTPTDPDPLALAESRLADWQRTVERTETGSKVLHAWRDGMTIRLHFHPVRGLTLGRADLEPMALHLPEVFVRPEPLLAPEDVRPGYELCPECEGLGWCDRCWGRGWTMGGVTWGGRTEGRARCGDCHGSRACPFCRGAGERPAR